MMGTLFQVALGGALGASGRYLTGVAAMRLMGPGFPWATLAVNVIGSFAIGLVWVLLAARGLQAASASTKAVMHEPPKANGR